jgi:hypothetical protein
LHAGELRPPALATATSAGDTARGSRDGGDKEGTSVSLHKTSSRVSPEPWACLALQVHTGELSDPAPAAEFEGPL